MIWLIAAQIAASGPNNPVQKAMDDWKVCTARFVNHYSQVSSEPAETIVEAANGSCMDQFRSVKSAIKTTYPVVTPANVEKLMADLTRQWRPQLVAGVLRLRGKAATAR